MGCKLLCLIVVAFIICLMSEHVRAECSPPRFGENVVLSDQFILSSSFSDGSSVTFECVRGYMPVNSKASRSVTCLGNKWTDLALDCTRKPCGSLPDFPHGRYEIPDGILFGDTVTAVCDKGYLLSGRGSQRTCRAEGVWDGRDPVCEAVKCPPPPVVENGQLEDVPLESYDYLQAVTYTCNRGFTLVGNSALYCSENGTFQPAPPKCVDGCPKPEIPHSVRIGGKSPPYKLGNFIKYKCEDGYDLKGADEILCTGNEWEPKPPKCDVKNVDPPNPTPHPPNPTPHPPNPTPTPTSTSTYVLSILGAIIGVALIGGAVYYFTKGKNSKREYSQKVPTRNEEGEL